MAHNDERPSAAHYSGKAEGARKAGLVGGQGHYFLWALLLITLAGGGLRLAISQQVSPVEPTGDERYYRKVAFNLARYGEHQADPVRVALRPPAHPYLLSLVAGEQPTAAAMSNPEVEEELTQASVARFIQLQVALGTVLILLTAGLGRMLFDDRVGLGAALIIAAYPTWIAFSHYIWAENLFTTALLLALMLALRAARSGQLHWPILAGLCFGVATLCREIGLLVAGAFALWLVLQSSQQDRRLAVAKGALMLLCCVVVVLPWTLRNYRTFDRLVPVSTIGPFALREGNTFDEREWLKLPMDQLRAFRRDYYAIPSEIGRMDFALDQSIDLIRSEQPGWIFKKWLRTTTTLLSPDSFLFKKLSRGSYGDVELPLVRAILLLTLTAYLGVATWAVFGIASAKDEGRRLLVGLILGLVFLVHLVTNASPRFRLPFVPLLAIYAAHAVRTRQGLMQRLSRPALVASVATVLLIFLWCLPLFLPDAISLWSTGSYVDPRRQ